MALRGLTSGERKRFRRGLITPEEAAFISFRAEVRPFLTKGEYRRLSTGELTPEQAFEVARRSHPKISVFEKVVNVLVWGPQVIAVEKGLQASTGKEKTRQIEEGFQIFERSGFNYATGGISETVFGLARTPSTGQYAADLARTRGADEGTARNVGLAAYSTVQAVGIAGAFVGPLATSYGGGEAPSGASPPSTPPASAPPSILGVPVATLLRLGVAGAGLGLSAVPRGETREQRLQSAAFDLFDVSRIERIAQARAIAEGRDSFTLADFEDARNVYLTTLPPLSSSNRERAQAAQQRQSGFTTVFIVLAVIVVAMLAKGKP